MRSELEQLKMLWRPYAEAASQSCSLKIPWIGVVAMDIGCFFPAFFAPSSPLFPSSFFFPPSLPPSFAFFPRSSPPFFPPRSSPFFPPFFPPFFSPSFSFQAILFGKRLRVEDGHSKRSCHHLFAFVSTLLRTPTVIIGEPTYFTNFSAAEKRGI